MVPKTRFKISVAASFAVLLTMNFVGAYLPEPILWIAYPGFLIGGAFVFGGPLIGLLLLAAGSLLFAPIFYVAIRLFCRAPSNTDGAQ